MLGGFFPWLVIRVGNPCDGIDFLFLLQSSFFRELVGLFNAFYLYVPRDPADVALDPLVLYG